MQGYNGQYCTTTFEGCAFTGSITSTTGTTNVGGFVGWSEWKNNNDDEKGYCTLVINNCFVKPYEDCISSGSMTFARCRNYEKLTINNGYYTQTIGDAQGQLVANDGTAAVGAATATYNVSGLTFYANGVKDSSTTFFNNANVIAREITGYGDSTDSDHWVFIASPATADTDPDDVVNLVAETADYYDLYKLVNTTWANYKAHEGNIDPGFNLVNGQGYLYATKETKTLVFTGPFNTGDSKEVNLSEGYNLVGNPFTVAAYVNKPYYTLNTDGSAVLTNLPITGNAILPCYGVIVEGENNNDKVTFSTTQPDESSHPNNGGLNVTLTQANTRGNAMLDNAIVSFNEGSRLGKFYFGNQSANIYIPQGNEDYAIAFSEGQGEMPLNFKANENGTYTLSVNPEGVVMNYLHLIDNLTGADVDLLDVARNVSTAPSYTFNAKTTDYESRFRLVFSTNSNETGSDSFAFFSNGNWIISNDGKAILQVIDVNGRILSSEQINGSVSKAIQSAPGVYVIRLANNENVKTQKIVVK